MLVHGNYINTINNLIDGTNSNRYIILLGHLNHSFTARASQSFSASDMMINDFHERCADIYNFKTKLLINTHK